MTCPTDERLRAHVDITDAEVAGHLTGCPACADRVAASTASARLAAAAIAGLDADVPPTVDVDTALRAVSPPPAARQHGHPLRRPVSIAAGVVGLLVAVVLVVTPAGRQAAAGFLASFRSERIQVVTFDPDEPTAGFDALADIVEVDGDPATHPEPTEVDGPQAAAEISGFQPTPVASLPDGATLDSVQASPPSTVRLTFTADRAPDLPPELDGAQLVVSLPGAVAMTYQVDGQALVVAEAEQLAVDAVGGDLAQIRGYLLGRPEVPADLARQLLAIDDWTTTLPIPVPVDSVVWQDTTVAGQPALMLQDPMGAGLLWQAGGRIHALGAEGLDIDELRQIADGIG